MTIVVLFVVSLFNAFWIFSSVSESNDEVASSLDSETEEKIQKALNKLTTNKTTIVIAHRLSTILNSDNIYVIDNGIIIDSGKHDDLLNNSKIYKNFYQRQLKQN